MINGRPGVRKFQTTQKLSSRTMEFPITSQRIEMANGACGLSLQFSLAPSKTKRQHKMLANESFMRRFDFCVYVCPTFFITFYLKRFRLNLVFRCATNVVRSNLCLLLLLCCCTCLNGFRVSVDTYCTRNGISGGSVHLSWGAVMQR